MCSTQQFAAWSSEEDEVLIDFVRTNEILYNVQMKEYRKSQLKKHLWHEIAEILKRTDVECGKRWTYIRDYYIRRRGKPGTGSSGEAAKKRTEQLAFLDSCASGKRSTISSIPANDSEENSTDDISYECNVSDTVSNETVSNETVSNINDETEESHVSNEDILGSTEEHICTTPCNSNSSLSHRRKYSSKSNTKNSDERMKLLREIAERNRQREIQPAQDENDLFFASMATIVKKLPEMQQSKIRLQIGNIIGNSEIEYLSGNTSRPPSASSYATSSSYNEDSQLLRPVASCSTPHASPVPATDDQYNLNCINYNL